MLQFPQDPRKALPAPGLHLRLAEQEDNRDLSPTPPSRKWAECVVASGLWKHMPLPEQAELTWQPRTLLVEVTAQMAL